MQVFLASSSMIFFESFVTSVLVLYFKIRVRVIHSHVHRLWKSQTKYPQCRSNRFLRIHETKFIHSFGLYGHKIPQIAREYLSNLLYLRFPEYLETEFIEPFRKKFDRIFGMELINNLKFSKNGFFESFETNSLIIFWIDSPLNSQTKTAWLFRSDISYPFRNAVPRMSWSRFSWISRNDRYDLSSLETGFIEFSKRNYSNLSLPNISNLLRRYSFSKFYGMSFPEYFGMKTLKPLDCNLSKLMEIFKSNSSNFSEYFFLNSLIVFQSGILRIIRNTNPRISLTYIS